MRENQVSGSVTGTVVQAGSVGSITINDQKTLAELALLRAARAAIVPVGAGRGVAVTPDLVLTLIEFVPSGADHERIDDRFALVAGDHGAAWCACVSDRAAAGDPIVSTSTDRGSPRVNTRTGAVCGLVGVDATLPELPNVPVNERWLDLLDADQLAAGGWRHVMAPLRAYLTTVRDLDRHHDYLRINRDGPPLRDIYLTRREVRRRASGERQAPQRITAEELLERHSGVQVLGGAGMGKSSLVRIVAAETAATFLSDSGGPLIPVPIRAADLLAPQLPTALATGAQRMYGHTLPSAVLAELFAAPPTGTSWLVLVDALDEVLDEHDQVHVLKQIATFRQTTSHRFLLTSRPTVLNLLVRHAEQDQYPTYTLTPFTEHELLSFVSGWLSPATRGEVTQEAREFVARARQTKLADLINVPLNISMLCLLHTRRRGGALPGNQSELYDQFVDWMATKIPATGMSDQLAKILARYGEAGTTVAGQLFDRVQDLLRHIAYEELGLDGNRRDMPLLDRAMAWDGVHPPANMSRDDWRGVLAGVLNMTGLVQPQGDDIAFAHQTIGEYLAACELAQRHRGSPARIRAQLRPRRRWSSPDTEVRIFLAARWLADGVDLHRPLARLLSPLHRRHNLEFIGELIVHGAQLDDQIARRMANVLCGAIRGDRPGVERWRAMVTWLQHLDPGRAYRELRGLALSEDTPNHLRVEAISAMLAQDLLAGLDVLVDFRPSGGLAELTRNTLLRQIEDQAPRQSADVLAEVVHRAEDVGLRLGVLEIMLAQHPREGRLLLRDIVADRWLRATEPVKLAELVRRHDPAAAPDIVIDLLTAATTQTIRRNVLRALGDSVTRDEVARLIRNRFDEDSTSDELRCQLAEFGADELDMDPDLLTRLVSESVDPRIRTRAAVAQIAHGGDKATGIAQVLEIYRDLTVGDPARSTVLTMIGQLDLDTAIRLLTGEVDDVRSPSRARLSAVQAATWMSVGERGELAARLCFADGVDSAVKLAAVASALADNESVGLKAADRLIEENGFEYKLRVITAVAQHSPAAGATRYADLSYQTIPMSDEQRFKAASKAFELASSTGRPALRALADGPRVARSIRDKAKALLDRGKG